MHKAYLSACISAQTRPIKALVAHLREFENTGTDLTTLDFSAFGQTLGSLGVLPICDILRQCSTLTTLCLKGQRIADDGCKSLVSALLASPSVIKRLDLSHCLLGGMAGKALGAYLSAEACACTELKLSNNPLGEGTLSVLSALGSNSSLGLLEMRQIGGITKDVWGVLGAALLGNHTLTGLDMSQNPLGVTQSSMSGWVQFCEGLGANSGLQSIRMESCDITQRCGLVLLDVLPANHTLVEMGLEYNRVAEKSVKAMQRLMHRNRQASLARRALIRTERERERGRERGREMGEGDGDMYQPLTQPPPSSPMHTLSHNMSQGHGHSGSGMYMEDGMSPAVVGHGNTPLQGSGVSTALSLSPTRGRGGSPQTRLMALGQAPPDREAASSRFIGLLPNKVQIVEKADSLLRGYRFEYAGVLPAMLQLASNEIRSLLLRLTDSEAQGGAAAARAHDLEVQLHQSTVSLTHLKETLTNLSHTNRQLSQQVAVDAGQRQSAEERVTDLERERQDVRRAREERDRAGRELRQLRQAHQDLTESYAAQSDAMQGVKRQNLQLKRLLKTNSTDSDKTVQSLQGMLTEAQRAVSSRDRQVSELQERLAYQQERMEQRVAQVKDLQRQLDAATAVTPSDPYGYQEREGERERERESSYSHEGYEHGSSGDQWARRASNASHREGEREREVESERQSRRRSSVHSSPSPSIPKYSVNLSEDRPRENRPSGLHQSLDHSRLDGSVTEPEPDYQPLPTPHSYPSDPLSNEGERETGPISVAALSSIPFQGEGEREGVSRSIMSGDS
ncbi:hypothetical protein KIPB_003475 [Kipferlia bialata]|uniref:Uncharacterized protein n=1 Tax=Kipferlia bialata TaxID=797122 RepID=A0A9K3CTY0_9EUKA|nr:hypothetical protein KIPB_003475 [Kipferlia bialata]|eukprot:g3475.t1